MSLFVDYQNKSVRGCARAVDIKKKGMIEASANFPNDVSVVNVNLSSNELELLLACMNHVLSDNLASWRKYESQGLVGLRNQFQAYANKIKNDGR